MSDLLIKTQLNSEQKDFTETIYSSAHTLLALINDILDISKIEVGRIDTEMIDFDLHELVNTVVFYQPIIKMVLDRCIRVIVRINQ